MNNFFQDCLLHELCKELFLANTSNRDLQVIFDGTTGMTSKESSPHWHCFPYQSSCFEQS